MRYAPTLRVFTPAALISTLRQGPMITASILLQSAEPFAQNCDQLLNNIATPTPLPPTVVVETIGMGTNTDKSAIALARDHHYGSHVWRKAVLLDSYVVSQASGESMPVPSATSGSVIRSKRSPRGSSMMLYGTNGSITTVWEKVPSRLNHGHENVTMTSAPIVRW